MTQNTILTILKTLLTVVTKLTVLTIPTILTMRYLPTYIATQHDVHYNMLIQKQI